MSIHSLPTVPLDPAVYHRLLVEASRRCRDGEDVRAVMSRLIERVVAATLGQLELEDVDAHGRHCRCERCVAPPHVHAFTDLDVAFGRRRCACGELEPAPSGCEGSAEWCHTHGRRTVHRGIGPVCPVSAKTPGAPR